MQKKGGCDLSSLSNEKDSKQKDGRLFTKEEYDFLVDVLGHVNYDKEESDIFWSVLAKIKDLNPTV